MIDIFKDKKRWDAVRTDKKYTYLLKVLNEQYQAVKDEEIPHLKFSMFLQSIKTGERKSYEGLYFKRRKMLTVYTLMSLVYPDEEMHISKLEDIICAICEEYTWSLPAHLPADRLNSPCHIDLFAAETGLYLAEVKYILSDRLSFLVKERMSSEIDRRIVQSFKNNHYIFEEFKSNWAAVCGGSVGATLLYENLDVYAQVRTRIEGCMKNYLESLDDEGVSSEGASYLEYGLSHYLLYSDLLKSVTFGRYDNISINIDKLKKAAGFIADLNMSRDIRYSYADSHTVQSGGVWYINYLKKYVNSELPLFYATEVFSSKTTFTLRNFLAYEPVTEGRSENKTSYYEKFGCVVVRKDKYAFAAKGGHNMEEHNHNDIGSFQLVSNNKSILCDLGAPVYTMQNLKIENYDKVIERSSLGHSVPIINGLPQHYGREYYAKTDVYGDVVKIDMSKAYPIQSLKLLRSFELKEDSIILTDEFCENVKWQERFVSRIKPKIKDGQIIVDCLTINFDRDSMKAETETVTDSREENVYLINITPLKSIVKPEFIMTFDKNATREGIN